jgi:hypothetical protein
MYNVFVVVKNSDITDLRVIYFFFPTIIASKLFLSSSSASISAMIGERYS